MDSQGIESLTSAVAPIVMVSAAGLLFNGIQTKNLHLSDRIRALAAEWRNPMTAVERQEQIRTELALFDKRIRLSQWALDFLYIAILCFVITSLLLASALWIGPPVIPGVSPAIFITVDRTPFPWTAPSQMVGWR